MQPVHLKRKVLAFWIVVFLVLWLNTPAQPDHKHQPSSGTHNATDQVDRSPRDTHLQETTADEDLKMSTTEFYIFGMTTETPAIPELNMLRAQASNLQDINEFDNFKFEPYLQENDLQRMSQGASGLEHSPKTNDIQEAYPQEVNVLEHNAKHIGWLETSKPQDSLGSKRPQKAKKCFLKIQLEPCRCTRTLQLLQCHTNAPNTAGFLQVVQKSSTCGSWATFRGKGQKVVSYSIYGKYPGKYHTGMMRLLPRVKEVYPGWVIRLYLDMTNPHQQSWACSLACTNDHLDLCNINDLPEMGDVSKSFWRTWKFSVVGDPLVDRYMVREADSPILQREVDAVAQWLKSGKCYHVMRDSIDHNVPMMAGTWGGCNSWEPSKAAAARVNLLTTKDQRPLDQDRRVLWIYLWPWIRENTMAHDSYTCILFPSSLPFPSQRGANTFIGMSFYRRELENKELREPCPIQCRPPEHQDWEYC